MGGKISIKHFAIVFFFVVVIGTFSQFETAAAASLRSRVTDGCTIDSSGVHKCPSGAAEETNGLDPRAETFFASKIPVSEGSHKYEFEANYFVTSATRTTILQLLNQDRTDSDVHKPVLFVVAWKQDDGNLKVCMFESCKYVWDDVPPGFRLRLKASGTNALLSIAGRSSVGFDLVSPLNGANRPNGAQELRWGVYHHDISDGRAASPAQVRVYNIDSSGF